MLIVYYGSKIHQNLVLIVNKKFVTSLTDIYLVAYLYDLKEHVLKVQIHMHSSCCKRHGKCRFNFPRPPTPYTLIAKPSESSSSTNQDLTKVRKQLDKTLADITLEELLEKTDVTVDQYTIAVSTSTKVMLSSCNVNNYNPHVMLAWQKLIWIYSMY